MRCAARRALGGAQLRGCRARRCVQRSAAPARAELVQEAARVRVRLARPLGLVLGERDGGEGVFVEELTPGGAAAASGAVEAGDWLVAVDGEDVAYASFDEVLDALAAGAPAPCALELERTVLAAVTTDAATGAAAYWANKRAAKAAPAAALRSTVPGLRSATDIRLGATLGGGSFGSVFEADWAGAPLVVKRANARVVGATELLECELALNELAAARAPGACAPFLGALDVAGKEAGELYNKRLNAGLWLVFALESRVTLADLLARRDGAAQLAAALRVPRADAVRAAGARLLAALSALHSAGLVHRDVKPGNTLVCAGAATLRLIDLGAGASCLAAPAINYAPGESPCDPLYCELGDDGWALPAAAEAPADDGANLAALWARHRPDAVDVYAAAVVLLQLALPALRQDAALRAFREQLAAAGGDLAAWRAQHGAAAADARGDAVLLCDAAWAALAAMVAPRDRRVSAADALQLPFFRAA